MKRRQLSRLAMAIALASGTMAQAETVPWQVVAEPTKTNGTTTDPIPRWTPLPAAAVPSGHGAAVQWHAVDGGTNTTDPDPVLWQPLPAQHQRALQTPTNAAEAQALLQTLPPTAADYSPLLRLGAAVPTANQLAEQQAQLSAILISPFNGGTAGGTGNQNHAIRLDAGLTDSIQLSGVYSNSDDNLYTPISSRSSQPANFWESYGGSLQLQLYKNKLWAFSLGGSLEAWNVGSGGCQGFYCGKDSQTASPNAFNNSGKKVYTRNTVGSLNLPISWQFAPQWQLSLSPGVSFLPASQGGNQGGSGRFYGTNIYLGSGVSWQPSRHVTLFGSAQIPFGPGTNSFDGNLRFTRVAILSGGVNWSLNPRISLEGSLGNGFGATPATSPLTLPSSNRVLYSARFTYSPGAPDTPQPDLGARRKSLARGGLTVNTALIPADGTTQIWGNADNKGNLFGYAGYSISNIAQIDLMSGTFHGMPQTNALANTYTNNAAPQGRLGAKMILLSPLRGSPAWGAARISMGREYPPGSGQGYLFAEAITTLEASRNLAIHINPKLAWGGVGSISGIGLGMNLQLGPSFQLIPEANIVTSNIEQTNASLALRWLASKTLQTEAYISSAAGLLDIGQLLTAGSSRIGARLIFSF